MALSSSGAIKSPSSSTKKRKASSSASKASSPKKSMISSSSSSSTTINVKVSPNNPEHDPIVVSFPRGVPNSILSGCSSSNDEHPPPKFTCSKLKSTSSSSSSRSSSRGLRITGQDTTCTYTASASGRGYDGRLTKSYVGIYNKKTKSLQLVPAAERGTIFALEQSVKEYTPNVHNGTLLVGGSATNEKQQTTASNQVQLLVESFGSKKKQKVMASRAANKVNINSVVGSGELMMSSVTKQEGISAENKKRMVEEGGSKMANPNEVAYEQARKRLLPPFDSNATSSSKVYNAQQFFDEAAWNKVSRIVEKVIDLKTCGKIPDLMTGLLGNKSNHRQESILMLFQSIGDDYTKSGSKYRLKVTFLLFLALKFHHRVSRNRGIIDGSSLDECIGSIHIPYDIGAAFFESFTTPKDGGGGGYIASKIQRDKLHTYMLIMYIIASGKEMRVTSLNQLCKEMKLDGKDASAVLREAGFVVKKNGVGDFGASLSVPLKFPPPKRGKRT